MPQVPTVPSQRAVLAQGSAYEESSSCDSAPQALAADTSQFVPTLTLDNHAFEFHESLPIVGNFPVPEEFLREPSGSSVYDPDSIAEESGRTYHGYKDGKYFLPNDAAEQDRLDFQHASLMILFSGRYAFAPIGEPEYVLDVATGKGPVGTRCFECIADVAVGTGIWALEFAQQHPQSTVIGTDLSNIQPDTGIPNCQFIRDDSEDEWLFNGIQFDYVHLRYVFSCFNDQKVVMKHAFNNMKPGAWIEYEDTSMEAGAMDANFENTAMKRLNSLCIAGAAAAGRDVCVAKHYKQWLVETGFVDVIERKMILPGNHWPTDPRLKRVGQYTLANYRSGVRGAAYKMLKFAGLSAPEIETLCLEYQQQVGDPQYRWFCPIYVVYGRKPYGWEVNGTKGS